MCRCLRSREAAYTAEHTEAVAAVHKALLGVVSTQLICDLLCHCKLLCEMAEAQVEGVLLLWLGCRGHFAHESSPLPC